MNVTVGRVRLRANSRTGNPRDCGGARHRKSRAAPPTTLRRNNNGLRTFGHPFPGELDETDGWGCPLFHHSMEEIASQTPQRILVVDDDVKLCRLVADYLKLRGYEVETVHTGADGLRRIAETTFHAVILDVMMPGMDGFATLQEIRRVSTVPVLMLTALGDESDRIVGLEMGADDYLPKNFSTRELLARLRAVTRRATYAATAAATTDDDIRVNELIISLASRTASINGAALPLTPLEFDLLACLAKNADRVLSRDRLLDEVNGRNYDVFDRSIDVHVSSLRRKLGDDPKNPRFIKTIRSAGYMLLRSN